MIRAGLLGCGRWGKNIAKTIGGLSGVELVKVYDPERATAEALGVVARDEAELISECDVVFIATPASMHYAHAKWALESGKPTFVEKPFATTEEHGLELLQLATEHDIPFFVDHEMLYHPAIQWIRENDTGRPVHFHGLRLNRGRKRDDVGVFLNVLVHDASVIYELFDDPRPIYAGALVLGNEQIEDHATVIFDAEFGYATVTTTWAHPAKVRTWDILFEKGHLFVDDAARFARWTPYETDIYGPTVDGEYQFGQATNLDIWDYWPLTASIEAFLNWVETGNEPLSSVNSQIEVYRALWRVSGQG
jgi:predicted dehydrogenase